MAQMALVSADRSVRALLKQGIEKLRSSNVPSYGLSAELFLLHVVSRDRSWLYSHPEEILSDRAVEAYVGLLERRASGVPTQYLTGKQEFWGLEFEVTPDVLIPRPETEHTVEVALDRLAVRDLRSGQESRLAGENVTLIDIGTGSGCIAIALAKELPAAIIYATDISKNALDVARRNAARHEVLNRIHFREANLLEEASSLAGIHTRSFFDLIVSNPPYIGLREADRLPVEVRDHEPHVALFGGEEGCELYRGLIPQSGQFLKAHGLLVLELGHDSLPSVEQLFDTSEWANIAIAEDLAGIPRVISAERVDSTGL
jgi:release factor glutamine methyltransferase